MKLIVIDRKPNMPEDEKHRIMNEIVKILFKHQCTAAEAEEILCGVSHGISEMSIMIDLPIRIPLIKGQKSFT